MSAPLVHRFRRLRRGGDDPAARLILEPGTIADYRALATHHYRAGPPATVALILRAVDPTDPFEPGPVGVLIVSMPTLNGAWRQLAWPGRFRTGDKRADARRLNREVRAISRLIIDPRWRGIGLGRRLVRAYLDRPLTPRTEALAAMGAICPVFAAAGMAEHHLPPTRRDRRLRRALAGAGLTPADLRHASGARRVEPHLRRWARDHGGTRRLAHAPLDALARLAASGLLARPVAYTHTAPGHARAA